MRMILLVHVIAGCLGLVFGYVALYAAKGATLHRRSGMLFVYVMLALSVTGAVMAVGGKWQTVNVPAAVLTAYLVVTALTTVRPPAAGSGWLNVGAMVVALAVGLLCLAFGLEALANRGNRNGVPAFAYLMFAVVGLLGGAGDIRMIRVGARLSQASLLLPIPVLVPLLAMLYWLWRLRIRRTGSSPEVPEHYGTARTIYQKGHASFLLVLAAIAASAAGLDAQYKAPRNEFGQPDLQGVWNFSSDVPLERSKEFADKKFFTREELEKQNIARETTLDRLTKLAPVEVADRFGSITRPRPKICARRSSSTPKTAACHRWSKGFNESAVLRPLLPATSRGVVQCDSSSAESARTDRKIAAWLSVVSLDQTPAPH